jgi:4-amino-4-deoxy-L-arabinose transferase-like glycosyltransferase
LPWAFARVFSKKETQRREIFHYLFFWFAVEFILINISSTKRDRYLIWGLTPLAYLIALEIVEFGAKLKQNRKATALIGVSGIILTIALCAMGFYLNRKFNWVPANMYYLFPCAGLICAALFGVLSMGRLKEAMVLFFVVEVFVFQARTTLLSRHLNSDLPMVEFSREIPRKVPADKKIFVIMEAKPAMVFYSGRFLYPVESIEQALRLQNNILPMYIISDDYKTFSQQYPRLKVLLVSSISEYEKGKKSAEKRYGLFEAEMEYRNDRTAPGE